MIQEGYSALVSLNGDDYLIQGKVEDELVMFRSVDDLLECERSQVQRMYEKAGEQLFD